MSAQLVLENVAVHYPNRVLFEDVNWTLYSGMRVALAGRNGSGKSTLLKILSGRMESPEGKCNIVGGRKLQIGFLDQSLLDSAVLQVTQKKEDSLSPLAFLKRRLEILQPDNYEEDRDWEIKKILSGLGFNQEWMENPMSQLSGGWLLRVFIGDTLLQRPEVLLLDEPTNHLDISSIQWLEEFLQKEYEGSLVLVTHDVALQKRVTDSLAIIHGGRFYFRPNFRDYLSFRDSLKEEKVLLEKAIVSLADKIADNMAFVEKFRAKAQTAARAQSKLKSAEDMQLELKQMKDKLQRLEGFSYNFNFKFRLAGAGGKFPIALNNLSFRYSEDSPEILRDISLDIKRGQRVAILGDNGTGKTTLLNVLAERLSPTSGELQKGHAVEMGYFGQHQLDELSLDDTVLDNLRSRAVGVSYEEVRGWLGAFGFPTQDDVDKKAKVLSGGERARLALLRILLTRINLVLLDEPTNHLDVETKDLLKQAIREFEGTTILVSHDREFVSEIAERILYLSHDHRLIDHIGDLESFFEKYPEFVRHLEGRSSPSRAPQTSLSETTTKPKSTLTFEERKKVKNQIKSLEKKTTLLEQELEAWGSEKETLEKEIANGAFSTLSQDERNRVYERLSHVQSLLHSGMLDWEKWSQELEELKAKF
ncbi:ATP-binding cassette domain-containing protein [bacterium]|nr:ATP-binding cassette domain-containing protein [bacterium]